MPDGPKAFRYAAAADLIRISARGQRRTAARYLVLALLTSVALPLRVFWLKFLVDAVSTDSIVWPIMLLLALDAARNWGMLDLNMVRLDLFDVGLRNFAKWRIGVTAATALEYVESTEGTDHATQVASSINECAAAPAIAMDVVAVSMRASVTVLLLVTVSPVTLVLLPLAVLSLPGARREAQLRSRGLADASHPRARADHLAAVVASPHAARELGVNGVHRWLLERMRTERTRALAMEGKCERRAALVGLAVMLPYTIGFAALGLVMLGRVQGDTATPGDLLLVLLLGGQLSSQLGAVVQQFQALGRVAAAASAARHIADAAAGQSVDPAPLPVAAEPDFDGPVRVSDMTFSYPGAGRPALRNVSLCLERGALIALVGPNGAGKTTFTKVLAGLYRANEGLLPSWRGHHGVVFQEAARFEFSLRDAVAVGRQAGGDTDDAVRAAIVGTGVADALEEAGLTLDTRVGAFFGGRNLSGGQWQVVAAARCGFDDRRAELIVLDEPTSAMDAYRATRYFDAIVGAAKARPDRVTIVTTHRQRLAKKADHVVVLVDGEVVQYGSQHELSARPGWYQDWIQLVDQDDNEDSR